MFGVFSDLGIRFEYPPDWEIDVCDDGSRTNISLEAPGGSAFALLTLDEDRPTPAEMAEEALEAMRAEYPGLEDVPAREVINGYKATGHDLSFLSLDMVTWCSIRCFRTPRRTIFFLGQWTDLDDERIEQQLRALRATIEETDAGSP